MLGSHGKTWFCGFVRAHVPENTEMEPLVRFSFCVTVQKCSTAINENKNCHETIGKRPFEPEFDRKSNGPNGNTKIYNVVSEIDVENLREALTLDIECTIESVCTAHNENA